MLLVLIMFKDDNTQIRNVGTHIWGPESVGSGNTVPERSRLTVRNDTTTHIYIIVNSFDSINSFDRIGSFNSFDSLQFDS